MTRALLDTDIYSEVMKARDPVLVDRASRYFQEHRTYTISLFTVAEIVKGFQKQSSIEMLQRAIELLKQCEMLTFNWEIALLAGRIQGDLERTGQSIGRIDPFIAATAITHAMVLISGNTRHYQRIIDLGYDLKLDDWREPASP